MKILLSIDETRDDLNNNRAENIAIYIVKNIIYNKYGKYDEIIKYKKGKKEYICIVADVNDDDYMEVIKDAEDIIKENISSEFSSPGICVVMKDKLMNSEEIIEFSNNDEIDKSQLRFLALRSGLYLKDILEDSEGIIGAFIGCALYLSGENGDKVEVE